MPFSTPEVAKSVTWLPVLDFTDYPVYQDLTDFRAISNRTRVELAGMRVLFLRMLGGPRMRSLPIAVVAVFWWPNCAAQIARGTSAAESKPYSTRIGQKIVLNPSGISFRIPQDWIDWFNRSHNNLHLTRQELSEVKDGQGEWDTEYAKVVNSALPFDDCAAHVGEEGWGRQGVSYGDVQLRAYVTNLSPDEVSARIRGPAFLVAWKVARPNSRPTIEDGHEDSWQKTTVSYDLYYGDYGGTAQVRFFVRPWKKKTLVLVFMGGRDEVVQTILKSVAF